MKSALMALLTAAALTTPVFAQDAHPQAPAHGHAHADFESGRFHVRVDGPDQPVGDVILIPGLSSSPEVWDRLTDELKGRYRVHRIHVQGFAGAPAEDNATGPVSAPVAEDLARYIAEQGLEKPAVIGHSMGGTIGMMLAARHPDSVGKLMVVDMVPFMGAMFGQPGTNPTAESVAPVAEDLARYIAEQGLEKPAVIGHSMGGTIAMMLAARHPDSVGKLMVVDMVPFMGAMFGQPGTNPTAESVAPVADMIHQGMANSSREQWLAESAQAITGMINTESERAGPLEAGATTDQKVAASAMRELIVTDLRPELASITAPTTVLYVKFNDPRMTSEITDGIYRASFANMPSAELKRIDDSAHFIMLDQPAVFAAEVNAILE